MAFFTGSSQSGQFAGPMARALPAALQSDACASQRSLNTDFGRKLAAVGVDIASDEEVRALLVRARAVAGDALAAVVLHGSWVRGEATPASDVDALIVVDNRLALSPALYRAWDAGPITWCGRRVDSHFVHLPAGREFSGLWAEVALDGVVLFERDWNLSSYLSRMHRDIAAGRLVRREVHGQPYWMEDP